MRSPLERVGSIEWPSTLTDAHAEGERQRNDRHGHSEGVVPFQRFLIAAVAVPEGCCHVFHHPFKKYEKRENANRPPLSSMLRYVP